MSFAFVFPGQGSQSVGMLGELAAAQPAIRATFDEAAEYLHYDLWKLVSEGPAEALNATERTQPAMLVAGGARRPQPRGIHGARVCRDTRVWCGGGAGALPR